MGLGPNGQPRKFPPGEDIYALVIYIPDPLREFLDELRTDLVPACKPHAHVSVLPPRILPVAPEIACEHGRLLASQFAPFEMEATEIEVFSATDVIYVGIGGGSNELKAMHHALNSAGLSFDEPFAYHPHITLAQDLTHEQVEPLRQKAIERWNAYPGSRVFPAERLTFVRNRCEAGWVDLAAFELRGVRVG